MKTDLDKAVAWYFAMERDAQIAFLKEINAIGRFVTNDSKLVEGWKKKIADKTRFFARMKDADKDDPVRMLIEIEEEQVRDVQYGHTYPLDQVNIVRELTEEECEFFKTENWDD